MWRLDLDGKGGGTWHKNSSASNPPFSEGILRPSGGAAAFTGSMGFLAGGYESNRTSPGLIGAYDAPGIVSYSFSNGTWANDTAAISSVVSDGSFQWGGMEYLSTLGPNGMIVLWGGQTTETGSYELGSQLLPMNTITLYDPVTEKFYHQNTTGTVPSARIRFCSVNVEDPTSVVRGSNKTGSWEIFMYSGYGGQNGSPFGVRDYDSIWALSIPAFTWANVYQDMTGGRYGHSCHVIGNRQLLALGGAGSMYNVPMGSPDYLNVNGIGVFDLTQAQWTNGYDANAAPYERPTQVQQYYDQKSGETPPNSKPFADEL